jgi:DNA-binding LacI/PurR family transcriptional regulator
MGSEAVGLLLGMIEDPSTGPRQVILRTRLVERSSTRAPAETT